MSEDTSKPVPSLSPPAMDYLKEEQRQRRQEIENLIARTESDHRNGLLFTGAIWGWLVTNVDKLGNNFAKAIVFVPALIVILFFYRWWSINKTILTIAQYNRELEPLFGLPAKPVRYGWEGWLADLREKEGKEDTLARASQIFWVLLIVANLGLAGYFLWLRVFGTSQNNCVL